MVKVINVIFRIDSFFKKKFSAYSFIFLYCYVFQIY